MNEIAQFFEEIPFGLLYAFLALIILSIARLGRDLLSPYKINEELTAKDNPAMGLSLTGYYIAVIMIFIGVNYQPHDFSDIMDGNFMILLKDVGITLAYSLWGIVLLNVAHRLVDKIILYRFSTVKEIIEDRNVGTGAVEFGSYLATGLIIAASVNGSSGGDWWFGFVTSGVFFLLGQLILTLFAFFYQVVTTYDIHHEIEQDNVAAGVALSGNLIAISLLVVKSIAGDFYGWSESLINLTIWSLAGFALLVVMRYLIDLFFVPNATITEEIVRDRNINAAYMEAALVIGFSAIILFIF